MGSVRSVQSAGTWWERGGRLGPAIGLACAVGVDLPLQPARATATDRARASGIRGRRTEDLRSSGKGCPTTVARERPNVRTRPWELAKKSRRPGGGLPSWGGWARARPAEPLVEVDPRRPAERGARLAQVEPVRGRELLGQEPGHRRVVGPPQAGPGELGEGTARAWATGRGAGPRAGRPGGRADPRDQLGERPRLAVGDDQRVPGHPLGVRAVERRQQRVDGVVDVRRVDERRSAADQRESAGAGPLDDAADQLGVAGAPDQVRADGDDGKGCRVGTQREPLGPCLGPARVVAVARSGSAGSAPAPTSESPACATDGEETCTSRGAPASGAASSVLRVPTTLAGRKSAHGPVPTTLAARCTTASFPAAARHRRGGVGHVAEPLAAVEPGRAALQHRHLVAAVEQRQCRRRAEHAAGPGDEDLHSRPARPPARTRSAQRARRARSILELCRMSTGSAGVTSTAATRDGAAPRYGVGQRGRGERPRSRRCRSDDHHDDLGGADRPDADGRGLPHSRQRLDPLLDADRRDDAGPGGDDVHQPALDPEPAVVVEVAHVARTVPAGVAASMLACSVTHSAVVAVLDVLGTHADLAGDAGVGGEVAGPRRRASTAGVRRPRRPASGRPTQTPSPAPAASISASEMSVTGSASVIPYGVCAWAAGRMPASWCSIGRGHRGTGRHQQPHLPQRFAMLAGQGVGGGHDVDAGRPARRTPPSRRRPPPRRPGRRRSACRAR